MLFDGPALGGLRRSYDALDEQAILEAKYRLLDTIVAILGGAVVTENAELAAIRATTTSPGRVRPVYPVDGGVSLESAAFLNGFLLRQADWGDSFTPGGVLHGHPSDQLAAVLGLIDDSELSGRRVIELVDLAYRSWAALYAAMPDLGAAGWDYTTVLALSVPILAAARYGDSSERLNRALLLSASGGMMLGQIRAGDVTNWKSGATGYALQRALWCYGLGAIFQAPPSTLQGTRGWDALVTPLRVEALQRPGPEVEAVYEQVAVKVYPCFQVAQTPVGCALRLRQELDGRIDRIRAVSVLLSEHGAGIANRAGRPRYPTTHGAADHHVPYCVAVALRYGTLTPAHFDHHFLEQPELRRLVELTEVRSMPPEVVAGEADACTLELTLDDGTRARQSLPRGEGAFSGLSAERRVAQLRSVVEAKRDLLEQASGWDLRPVVELLERLEERDGAALIQQVHACVERDGRAAG